MHDGGDGVRYLPRLKGPIQRAYYAARMAMTYDVWRRHLSRHGAWSRSAQIAVLECGSGPGFFLRTMGQERPNARCVGLDIEPKLLRFARRQATAAAFVQGDATRLPFDDGSFDAVVALHVIEHLVQPLDFLQEARRVLRPGGLLAMATPNPAGVAARILGSRWGGWDDDSHVSVHGPAIWRDYVQAQDFQIVRDGTTGLSGIRPLRRMPLALLNWVPLYLFGFFPWQQGEAYVCIARAGCARPVIAAPAPVAG